MSGEIPELVRGDCLIYSGTSLVDKLIQLKTWSFASHVEVYLGGGNSAASRNGIGVGVYPLRVADLAYVLRPKTNPDLDKGMSWFYKSANGQPYNWADLLRFFLLSVPGKGMICSQMAALLYVNSGWQLISEMWEPGAVAPGDFLMLPGFDWVWRRN